MPLTSDQREHLEKRLREDRDRTIKLLNAIVAERARTSEQDAAGDLTLMPLHPADIGTDTMNEELDQSNATRATQELNEIDAALERLYRNPTHFGLCDDGREIPFE